MADDGVAYVELDFQWLRYVQETTANHKFIKDWGRRMEESLVPVRSVKVEELSRETRRKDRNKGEEKAQTVGKNKGATGTLIKK